MGAAILSLHRSTPSQLQLREGEILLTQGATPVQQLCHEKPPNSSHKRHAPAIPGGVYTISPLTVAGIWAALKTKLVAWHHLCV